MAGVIRAFIAIELSTDIQHKLDEVMATYKGQLPHNVVRWVPASNIHLTLKFLGDVSLSNLSLLNRYDPDRDIKPPPIRHQCGRLRRVPEYQAATRHLGGSGSTL